MTAVPPHRVNGLCTYCGLDHAPAGPGPACIERLRDEVHAGQLIVAALEAENAALRDRATAGTLGA